jgi:hypothetical protein
LGKAGKGLTLWIKAWASSSKTGEPELLISFAAITWPFGFKVKATVAVPSILLFLADGGYLR